MTEDGDLLRAYCDNGSRGALEKLVQRHFNLVYSAALRQVRNPSLAEDITQAVFLTLIQKAGTIRSGGALGGWLLAVTRSVVVSSMRKQTIDRKHEQRAARPEALRAASGEWKEIAPVIDAELSRLSRKDRDAIVLRFFEDRSFAEIGAELGLSEDAARMRVGRSLERLRTRMKRRKHSITADRLSAAIGAFAVSAAPRHYVARTITAISSSPAPHVISLTKGAIKMLAYTKAKLIGTVAASLVLGGAGVVVLNRAIANDARQAAPAVQTNAPPRVAANTIAPTARVASADPAPGNAAATPASSGTASNSPTVADAPKSADSADAPAMSAGSPGGFGELRSGGWGSYIPPGNLPDELKK